MKKMHKRTHPYSSTHGHIWKPNEFKLLYDHKKHPNVEKCLPSSTPPPPPVYSIVMKNQTEKLKKVLFHRQDHVSIVLFVQIN